MVEAHTPRATVIVPVFNCAASIGRTLEALSRQTVIDDLHIVIVDDASTDGTAEAVARWIADRPNVSAELHRRAVRGGTNASRNDGIRNARSEAIMFCDGDDITEETWAAELLAALERDPRTGRLVGGACVEMASDGRFTDNAILGDQRCGWLPYAPGGNCAFMRSTAMAVGGFDESIRTGGTEIDFALRVHDAVGLDVEYVPSARIGYVPPSTARRRLRRRFLRGRGHAYIGRRHAGRIGFSGFSGVVGHPWRCVADGLVAMMRRRRSPLTVAEDIAEACGLAWWTLVLRFRMPPSRCGLSAPSPEVHTPSTSKNRRLESP